MSKEGVYRIVYSANFAKDLVVSITCSDISAPVATMGALGTTYVNQTIYIPALKFEDYSGFSSYSLDLFYLRGDILEPYPYENDPLSFTPTETGYIDHGAESRILSAKDILFSPYIYGAGFPHTDRSKSAEIRGLTATHDKYDIARALMEGVAFETKAVLSEFHRHGANVGRLLLAGRAGRSEVWRGIIRDITDCHIGLAEAADTGCMGAAAIAAAGCGMHKDLKSAVSAMCRTSQEESPNPENVAFYAEKYQRYIKCFCE